MTLYDKPRNRLEFLKREVMAQDSGCERKTSGIEMKNRVPWLVVSFEVKGHQTKLSSRGRKQTKRVAALWHM